jgi:hypothetical protein
MRYLMLMTGLILAASLPAQAAEKPLSGAAARIQTIPQLPQTCSRSPEGDVCLHAFGGLRTRIPLQDTKEFSCDEIEVRLFQLSSRLAAPVGEKVALKGARCNEVILPLPEVKEKTLFKVLFTIAGSQSARNPDMTMQETLIAVYPSDQWAPLKEWSEVNNLVVIDRGRKLIRLLDELNIRHSAVVMPRKGKTQQVCLCLPVSDNDAEEPAGCNPLLVLHEKTDSLPMIHTLESPGRYRADVYMPLVRALEDNPLAQKTFIDLIQTTLRGD